MIFGTINAIFKQVKWTMNEDTKAHKGLTCFSQRCIDVRIAHPRWHSFYYTPLWKLKRHFNTLTPAFINVLTAVTCSLTKQCYKERSSHSLALHQCQLCSLDEPKTRNFLPKKRKRLVGNPPLKSNLGANLCKWGASARNLQRSIFKE